MMRKKASLVGASKANTVENEEQALIRVFAGGTRSNQVEPFLEALQPILLDSRYRSEVVYCDDIRKFKWSPFDFVAWVMEADFHFILTHLHQGIPQWNVEDVLRAIVPLKRHPGFPCGIKLFCPVFTQNKFKYLRSLPSHMHTPTLSFDFKQVHSRRNYKVLDSFLNAHNEGNGWIVKLPFVTNREGIRFCKSKHSVVTAIEFMADSFEGRIPYCMVQPCLANRSSVVSTSTIIHDLFSL